MELIDSKSGRWKYEVDDTTIGIVDGRLAIVRIVQIGSLTESDLNRLKRTAPTSELNGAMDSLQVGDPRYLCLLLSGNCVQLVASQLLEPEDVQVFLQQLPESPKFPTEMRNRFPSLLKMAS
ncbi:MAG: hypothetical protein SFW62_01975 [Alphaproteobacteria bacterium]|nr:hypothetical protein [Alphaproteobacteria bacterium]